MYICAGYYLVSPREVRQPANAQPFPKGHWSVSAYTSHLYPGPWGFSWVPRSKKLRDLPPDFRPSPAELTELQAWIEAQFAEEKFGWPGFFFDQSTAAQFRNLYLAHLPEVKLLGIFLHEDFLTAALAQLCPNSAPDTTPDFPTLSTLLAQRHPEPTNGQLLGFDLLGILENYGGYEPFSFHVRASEYEQHFGIRLNEYDLFTTQAECQQVATYTDEVAGEPAVWLPFKVKLFA